MQSAHKPKYYQYRQDVKQCRSQLKNLYDEKQSKLMKALFYLNDQQKISSPQVNQFLLQQRQSIGSTQNKLQPTKISSSKIGQFVDSISQQVIEERRLYRQKMKNKQIQMEKQAKKQALLSSPQRNNEYISSYHLQNSKNYSPNFAKQVQPQYQKKRVQYDSRLRKIENYHQNQFEEHVPIQPITGLNRVNSNNSLSIGYDSEVYSPVFGRKGQDSIKQKQKRITQQHEFDGKMTGYYTIVDSEDERNRIMQQQRQMQKIRQVSKKHMNPSINKIVGSEFPEYDHDDYSIINNLNSNKMLLKPSFKNQIPTREKSYRQQTQIRNSPYMQMPSERIDFKKKGQRSQYQDFIQRQQNKLKQQSTKSKYLGDQIYAVLQGQEQYQNFEKNTGKDKIKSYQQLQLSNGSEKNYEIRDNGNYYRIQPFLEQNYNFEEGLKYMMSEIIDLFAISELIRYILKFKTFEVLNKIYSYGQLKFCSSSPEKDANKQKISISLFIMLVTRMLPKYKKSQINSVAKILFGHKQQLNFEEFGKSLTTTLSDHAAQQLSNTIVSLNTTRTQQLIKKLFTTWIQINYLQHRLRSLLRSQSQKMQQFTEIITLNSQINVEQLLEYLSNEHTSNMRQKKLKIQLYLNKILNNEYTQMSWLKWIYSQDQ